MFYRRKLPHLQRDSKPHFITFVTDRRTILPECARDIVLASCLHDRDTRYDLHAAVVMPDHVHLILTPLNDMTRLQVWSLPEILDAIKGASAHMINRRSGRRGPVWQEESFAHVLRSSEASTRRLTTFWKILSGASWSAIIGNIAGCVLPHFEFAGHTIAPRSFAPHGRPGAAVPAWASVLPALCSSLSSCLHQVLCFPCLLLPPSCLNTSAARS